MTLDCPNGLGSANTPLHIVALPGDGIGPEMVAAAKTVLNAITQIFGIQVRWTEGLIGGAAIDAHGVPFPEATKTLVQDCHAVFLGSVGDFKYDTLDPSIRPEQGLLAIRKALGLFANIRPVKIWPQLVNASTLKPEVLEGTDLVVVRELTGGLYFSQPKGRDGDKAVDTLAYTTAEIERIAHVAFQLAQTRRKQVCSVDKANVLATSQLWRDVVTEVATHYPDVALSHMYVDNAAMQLIRNPRDFDVLLTENTFGDILSDEAAMLAGSLGMLPSSSLGASQTDGGFALGLFEPCHGSAPQFKGLDRLNPIAQILSLAMLLDHCGFSPAAEAIHAAVYAVLSQGQHTEDIPLPHGTCLGTQAMANAIAKGVLQHTPLPAEHTALSV